MIWYMIYGLYQYVYVFKAIQIFKHVLGNKIYEALEFFIK